MEWIVTVVPMRSPLNNLPGRISAFSSKQEEVVEVVMIDSEAD